MGLSQRQSESEALWRKLTLPEEDRDPWVRHVTHRWFRSSNIVDLWHYRSSEEKARIRSYLNWTGNDHNRGHGHNLKDGESNERR
jgi:hypothetical protein